MKKRIWLTISLLLFGFLTFGPNPFAPSRDMDGLFERGYGNFETKAKRQSNGVYKVQALTVMPGVEPQMVHWWFAEYMQTTEHYKIWHPSAHIWMDWENKKPGEIIGASHLVHESLGADPTIHKLRIQFVPPEEILGEALAEAHLPEDRFIICARAGLLDEPINVTTMCHLVLAYSEGTEMRSVFWMGQVAKRDGNDTILSIDGVLGNTWLARQLAIRRPFAENLKIHATEEMSILAGFLPELYAHEKLLETKSGF